MRSNVANASSYNLAFTRTAIHYWLGVFPQVRRELTAWRIRALAIPNPALRRQALLTLDAKRGNPEGAAAFAVLAPAGTRPAVVRAVVAFQAMYDYLDTLSEDPRSAGAANARQLHSALPSAFAMHTPGTSDDPYRYHSEQCDGGYLAALMHACQNACAVLPRYAIVNARLLVLADHIAEYQAHNSTTTQAAFASWSQTLPAPESDLHWWELAAAAGSSLAIHALIAAASHPTLDHAEADKITRAYFPWVGALHTLLDSLVDQIDDERDGHHSFVGHYRSPNETAQRLGTIARQSVGLLELLPAFQQHLVILAGMTSFYAANLADERGEARQAVGHVLDVLGRRARLPGAIFCLRRLLNASVPGAPAP
jgi:tetraprenyl-beta-curcumene synthase